MEMIRVAENIKKLMENRGISKSELEMRFQGHSRGICSKTIYNVMNGKNNVTFETLNCIADVLDVPLSYLFREDDQPSGYTLTDSEKRLVDIHRNLSEKLVGRLEGYAEALRQERKDETNDIEE